MMIRSVGIKQTELERGKEQGWRAHPLGAPPVVLASSSLLSRPSKAPEGSRDLKTPYIKVPEASREGAARRSRNTEIQPEPATIGGELSSGAATGEISYPSKIKSLITMMRRE